MFFFFVQEEGFKPNPSIANLIEGLFVYGLIWSVGGNTDSEGKIKFDQFMRQLVSGQCTDVKEEFLKKKINISPPEKGTVFDYLFSYEKKK